MLEEIKALEKSGIWEFVDLPRGKKTVGRKRVFTVKYKSDGLIGRYKARLVAKGFTQSYGIDYQETLAPVAKLNTIRVLLSLAANLNWQLCRLDVKNAFLNGDLAEEVFMDIPSGFERFYGMGKVCKLRKSFYGLKQSPRAWFDRFSKAVKRHSYSQAQADHTLFYKSLNGKLSILIVYVDDISITGDDVEEAKKMKNFLAREFEIKDLGPMKYVLRMEVARSKRGISVSQGKYTLDLLKETGFLGSKPVDTPIEANRKIGYAKGEVPVDKGRCQRLVGRLIYLSQTRPDITYAISVVSQFMHEPYEEPLEAVHEFSDISRAHLGRDCSLEEMSQERLKLSLMQIEQFQLVTEDQHQAIVHLCGATW